MSLHYSSYSQKIREFLEDNPINFHFKPGNLNYGQCKSDVSVQDNVVSTLDLADRTDYKLYLNGEYNIPHVPLETAAYGDNLKPLTVYIVPHSHVDPGWVDTVDGYYVKSVKKILNSMVKKLHLYSDMTFIWAEIVYFSRWYDELKEPIQAQVKDLIKSGRVKSWLFR